MSTQTQTHIANEALLPVTARNIQNGIFNHHILNSDLDLNSPTAVLESTDIDTYISVAPVSYSPAGLRRCLLSKHTHTHT